MGLFFSKKRERNMRKARDCKTTAKEKEKEKEKILRFLKEGTLLVIHTC